MLSTIFFLFSQYFTRFNFEGGGTHVSVKLFLIFNQKFFKIKFSDFTKNTKKKKNKYFILNFKY